MAMSGFASADILPGAVPENQIFTTTSLVDGVGITDEKTSLTWRVGDGPYDRMQGPRGTWDGVDSGSVSYALYRDDIKSNGGQISEVKSFTIDTHGKDEGLYNVETEKIMTYNSQNGSHLMATELYILDVMGNWTYKVGDNSLLCVFTRSGMRELIPAFCNKVTAESKLRSITTAQLETVGAMTAVAAHNELGKHSPAALNYAIALSPDANSASGYAEGIVSTTFTISVREGRIDGNFSPGLRPSMVSFFSSAGQGLLPIGASGVAMGPALTGPGSPFTGIPMDGLTVNAGVFESFVYGSLGGANTLTFGNPTAIVCPRPGVPGYSPSNAYTNPPPGANQPTWIGQGGVPIAVASSTYTYGTVVPAPAGWTGTWPTLTTGSGHQVSSHIVGYQYLAVTAGPNPTMQWQPIYQAVNAPTLAECEAYTKALYGYDWSNPADTDLWNSLSLQIIKEGNEIYALDLFPGNNPGLGVQGLDGNMNIIQLDGIRIEYKGDPYSPSTGGTQGQVCTGPSSWGYTGCTPGTTGGSGPATGNGNDGTQGQYTQGPIAAGPGDTFEAIIYFEEQFGEIPPGSTISIATSANGELMVTGFYVPYGNGGWTTGEPYLEAFDELAASLTTVDTATVAGGISNFIKDFRYVSGVSCKDC